MDWKSLSLNMEWLFGVSPVLSMHDGDIGGAGGGGWWWAGPCRAETGDGAPSRRAAASRMVPMAVGRHGGIPSRVPTT